MYIADIHAVGNEVVQIIVIMSLMTKSSKMIILYYISNTPSPFSGLDLFSKMSKPVKKKQQTNKPPPPQKKQKKNKQTNKQKTRFLSSTLPGHKEKLMLKLICRIFVVKIILKGGTEI